MRFLHTVFAFLLCVGALAQNGWEQVASIPLAKGDFTTDNLGQLYTWQGNLLKRYDANGKLQYTFNNKTLGNIAAVDATNPLRVVVFYQELSQVVFLDNTLSEHGQSLALTELGYDQATVLCGSQNNGVWLYDQVAFELVWIDEQANVGKRSGNLVQQLGFDVEPTCMIERHNWLYLNDPARGLLVFDIFGTYYKTIPIKGLERFQVGQRLLTYLKNGALQAYDMKLLEAEPVVLPATADGAVRIEGKHLFLRAQNAVLVYRKRL